MKKKIMNLLNPFRVIGVPVYVLAYIRSLEYKKGASSVSQVSLLLVRRYLGTIYSFCIALNLVFFVYYCINMLKIQQPDYPYFIGVALYFNPHKKIELTEYVLGSVVLGLWFVVSMFYENLLSRRARLYAHLSLQALTKKNYYLSAFVVVVDLILPAITFSVGHYNFTTLLVEIFCLLVAIIVPFWSYLLRFGHSDIFNSSFVRHIKLPSTHVSIESRRSKIGFIILLLCGISFLCYVFYIPIIKQPQIINEYYNIPEQTILKNNHIVDNTNYWRTHFISPSTFKGDVATELYTQNCFRTALESINVLTPKLDDYGMYYDKLSKQFCINGNTPISAFNTGYTARLDHVIVNNNEVIRVDGTLSKFPKDLYNILEHNNTLSMEQQLFSMTDEEAYFLNANKFEINWQFASRFMIHHNSFMYIPISILMLKDSSTKVSAQYGYGSAKLFAAFFSKLGDISLDNWFRLSYCFYFIYFISLLFIIYVITRSLAWTFAIFMLTLTTINLHGYIFVLLPPGDAPWRNIFDIFVMSFLFLYTNNRKFVYYIFALFLGCISVYINPQIGMMISFATALSGVFYSLYNNNKRILTLFCSLIAILCSIYCMVSTQTYDDLAKYYIDGVIGFHISLIQLTQIFVCIIVIYLLFYRVIKHSLAQNYVHLMFLIIYSQELLLYVVWHFNTDGFLARSHIYVLTIMFLLFQFRGAFTNIPNYVKKSVLLLIFILYIFSAIFMCQSKEKYEDVFKQHVTYKWNMDRAHIVSTVNPIYFESGIKLIDKYSQGSNGIYIISEYDNILPFLAHKYSLMPFFDMKWYMITPNELNRTIDLLKFKQPKYLFVDTNVGRNLNNEIIEDSFPVVGQYNVDSSRRVFRLKLLNTVYQNVAAEYTLVESSSLISVYKRIK